MPPSSPPAPVSAAPAAPTPPAGPPPTAEYAIADLRLGGGSGLVLIEKLTLVEKLIEADPAARVVLLTGRASIRAAVEAIRLGAMHYLAKPHIADDLIAAFDTAPPPPSQLSIKRLEWEHIQTALAENAGNVSATARALKMHRRTLQRKLCRPPPDA